MFRFASGGATDVATEDEPTCTFGSILHVFEEFVWLGIGTVSPVVEAPLWVMLAQTGDHDSGGGREVW